MLRKLGQNYQIALPKEIVDALHLHINDYLDIKLEDNTIVIEPQLVIPKVQAYFYTSEWQKEEAEAHQDIQEGRTTKTENINELFEKLDH
ncbi:MAG: AbrB/MazE/SpoVT family DNA-binding domain-containing protein [bacterium]